jgi:acetyl esterase
MAALLDRIDRVGRPSFHELTPVQARAAYEAGANVLEWDAPPLETVQSIDLTRPDGTVLPARLYASAQDLPVALYFHGGGYVVGSLNTHDALCKDLAQQSGVAFVSVDYRLAPEHPFPAAFDDACAALVQVMARADTLGVDASRVAVCGDSAGGALAAAVSLWARDQGMALALQALITPHTTTTATASRRAFEKGYLIDRKTIDWFFHHASPDGLWHDDWRFSPLHAPSVDDVAPMALLLAECDPLVDEGLAYADRLRAAGVPVTLELVQGVTHEFIKFPRVLPQAVAARAWLASQLRAALKVAT